MRLSRVNTASHAIAAIPFDLSVVTSCCTGAEVFRFISGSNKEIETRLLQTCRSPSFRRAFFVIGRAYAGRPKEMMLRHSRSRKFGPDQFDAAPRLEPARKSRANVECCRTAN
ncbi:hypothetical protein FOMPIDRAFT_1021246 [Fomitopsis schrenkii]|uniref:Uncharacterized protein n=1 Tax=Fomitopsis schrenkii TaxID=2126942 RepID=S8EQW6_FOMSC|nr:hypothetical protein FOMPIDRAFT_1021246 [Fomitopsis schrenkii]